MLIVMPARRTASTHQRSPRSAVKPRNERGVPVREIVGVHPVLIIRWSARRAAIEARRSVLATDFQRAHGRPPTPVESLQLAQQATLETRQAKHQPRSLAEQRRAWFAQAVDVLGGPDAVQGMVREVLTAAASPARDVEAAWLDAAADRVLSAMEERRSTWQVWHVRAEAQRYLRAADAPLAQADRLVDLLVDEVMNVRSVSLARPDTIVEPKLLQRSDGASVYTVAGAELFTSTRILEAEQRLVATAGRRDGHAITTAAVDMALLEATANGVSLNAGQAALVRDMSTSGARLQLAIAPAGTGKTTAMQALAAAWRQAGGTVIGLAPTAAAAAVLRDQIHTHCETLAKLTTSLDQRQLPEWAADIGPSTLVVIDEAGMADTVSLDAAVSYIIEQGGSVRLIGDDQQLAAIGAGGVLRDIRPPTGQSGSPSRCGSATLPKPPPPSPYATAGLRRSGSISTTSGSTSATSPPSPNTSSPPGSTTAPKASIRSCSPPPANSSPNSTRKPAPTDSPTQSQTPMRR